MEDILTSGKLGITTDKAITIREFIQMTFHEVGIMIGFEEKAFVVSCNNPDYIIEQGKEIQSVEPKYFRPTEVEYLFGNPSKAKNLLGWMPEYDLKDLVTEMMESDMKLMERDHFLIESGYYVDDYYE